MMTTDHASSEPSMVGYATKQEAWEDGYDAGVAQGRFLASQPLPASVPEAAPVHDCSCTCHDDYFKLADPGDHYVR